MPSGPRIRDNNVYGLTTDNPLTAGAVTFNSPGLANMSAVSSAHAVVTLDPLREFGEPEIVVVTAHTASATVATIVRGQYGTVARSHPQNTTWVHAPIDEDFIEILTSGTRPSNPYEGQFIFETNTNKLVGYGGVDWAPRDAGGQLGYAAVNATLGAATYATVTALAGLTTNVTVGTGRRVKVTGYIFGTADAVPSNIQMRILEDGTEVQLCEHSFVVAGQRVTWNGQVILSPTAGAHTYSLSAVRSNGTANVTFQGFATDPLFILVEDIGAA